MRTTNVFFVMSDELICPMKTGPIVTPEELKSVYPHRFNKYLVDFQKKIGIQFSHILSGSFTDNTWSGKLQSGTLRDLPTEAPINIRYENPSIVDKRDPKKLTVSRLSPLPRGGSFGTVPLVHFQENMTNIFRAVREGLPIFAVIDHNSAHHMSYILAKEAFSNASTGQWETKKVVINFDNHADGNDPGEHRDYIHCNNWAYHLFLDHDGSGVDDQMVYISVGAYKQPLFRECVAGETSVYYGKDRKKLLAGKLKDNCISEILENIRLALGFTWNEAYVYITVDRDFMIGSFTSYGDGNFTLEEGRNAVAECLSYLDSNDAYLVGFDIIGFPIMKGQSEGNKEWGHDKNMPVEQSITDIRTFFNLVSHYGEPCISDTLRATMPVERS